MMAAKRLPWIKFYPELLEHEKFADLSDAESWTWINVWGKASQQTVRWRFASPAHAAKVTGRSVAQIRKLIAARLLDERSDGLWVHDWQQWQQRYPSDYEGSVIDDGLSVEDLLGIVVNAPSTLREDSANAPPLLPEDSVNGAAILHEDSVNAAAMSGQCPSRGAERAKTKTKIESTPNGVPREVVPKPNRSAEVIDAIRALGQEPTMTERDHAAVKRSTAKPEVIAEVYCAVFRGDYGDDFMQRRLSVHEAIGWIDGYRSQKTNGLPKSARPGRPEPTRNLIDKTGVEN